MGTPIFNRKEGCPKSDPNPPSNQFRLQDTAGPFFLVPSYSHIPQLFHHGLLAGPAESIHKAATFCHHRCLHPGPIRLLRLHSSDGFPSHCKAAFLTILIRLYKTWPSFCEYICHFPPCPPPVATVASLLFLPTHQAYSRAFALALLTDAHMAYTLSSFLPLLRWHLIRINSTVPNMPISFFCDFLNGTNPWT